jgi:urease subunit alpha
VGLTRATIGVRGTRSVTKRDMVHNDALPRIEVDPETYRVRIDGEDVASAPATRLPLAQRYFLF